MNYATLDDAAHGLLADVANVVKTTGASYVVIGGWSPYLLNRGTITHPGTHDVDLLFEKGATPEALEEVVKELLGAGYLSSAKHTFQLLRPLSVGGREFVFNVDLLHATHQKKVPEQFVDHLTLLPESVHRA